jgi:hypothetical protein
MLDHANPRDLNQSELDALEALIDAAGIEAVVQGLSEICGAKAEHIASNWQDTALGLRFHHPRLAKKKNRKGSFLLTKVEFQKLFRRRHVVPTKLFFHFSTLPCLRICYANGGFKGFIEVHAGASGAALREPSGGVRVPAPRPFDFRLPRGDRRGGDRYAASEWLVSNKGNQTRAAL